MRNLLDFLYKYHHWLVFILLELVSVVLLFQFNSYQGSAWLTAANSIVGSVYDTESKMTSYLTMAKLNEELTIRNINQERQLDQLRRLYAEAIKDTTDMQRKELEYLSNYKLIPAKVVENSIHKLENLIIIDKGRKDGVKPDMGVACGNGIVGVVYLVSDHYSVVISALNAASSHISCSIRNRGYFGYLHWYGGDPSVAYVEEVPRHAKFKLGEWMETSGFSSIFPSGVLVGKIEQAYNSSDGLSYKLKVRLSTDFGNLRDVVVMSDESIAERAALMQAARDSISVKQR
ncbi:MAG: rod shape-determining protein MreC [Prevotella sp.]|nr:rod shape-determining protein MreC [Prevotella sp.]